MFAVEYYLGLILIGIVAGFASGLLGVGGGFLIVPFQYFLLKYIGVEPDLALLISFGTSLAIIIPTAISGAFLLPKKDAQRELGIRRSAVTADMKIVAKEYGISMMLLVKRAEICGIIRESAARDFYIVAGQHGWRGANSTEPTRIPLEEPSLFSQLVCRAIAEDEISIQRGAELLNCPYQELVDMCSYQEV